MAPVAEPLFRKTVTVLFCDVTGFTSLGERVDPETMRRVMIRYFDEMRTVLERHGGTVEKFIGDAIVAVFGVPLVHEDDALRAVRAADEMRRALELLNDGLEERFGLRLEERIGINTGEVVVGDPATQQTVATGDAVNVAARLQQAAQPGDILLGRETFRLVRDRVDAGPLQAFSLKGKADAVSPWRLEQVHERAAGMLRRLDSPFVGRQAERELLERAYQATVEESGCRAFAVVGPPGIGKTRLAQECVSRLLSAAVLQGRCLPYGEGITFWPITEIVRSAASISSDDTPAEARAKIAALLPPIEESALVCERVCGTIGLGERAPRTEESFWALRRLFEAIASARPLVIVLEDLHWAEPALLDLLQYLVGWSTGAPILILCLTRPELIDARPSLGADAVVLEPLPDSEIEALTASALGSQPVDPVVAERVAEAADGNPLFAEEFVRMLVDEGALAGEAGVWSATRDLDELAVPASINALLAARLDRLDADEREAIQCAAVVGKEFWWGSVADLVDPELCDDVATRLHALVRKRLIVPAGSAVIVGEDAFRFSHILVRDAAYGALPKSRRADLHERHAGWLLGKSDGRATQMEEIVGYHLEQAFRTRAELGPADAAAAGLAARAVKHLAASGRRALERGDSHAAAGLLGRASALGEAAAAEVAPELGTALMQSGALSEAEDVLSRAVEAATRAGDARRAAHAAVVRGDVHLRTHPTWALEETRTVGEQAIETFARAEDDRGLAVALRLLSFTQAWHCEWHAMTEALERALLHADRTGDLLLRATIVTSLNVSLYYGPTPVDEVIRRYEAVLESVEDESVASGETSCLLAGVLAMSGRFDEARSFAGRGTMILAELGQRVRLGIARAYVADAELLAGDARAAEHELVEAYATLDGIGNKSGAFSAAWELASILCGQGRHDEADRWAAPGRDVLEESDVMTRVTGLATEARLAAHAGRGEHAASVARRAVTLADRTDALNVRARTWLALAEVMRLEGKEAQSDDAVRTAVALYESKGNVTAAGSARATGRSSPTAPNPSSSTISGSSSAGTGST
jgi:class 3 adenylate cyclase/tetratricopeptide (TPR) repeat protein